MGNAWEFARIMYPTRPLLIGCDAQLWQDYLDSLLASPGMARLVDRPGGGARHDVGLRQRDLQQRAVGRVHLQVARLVEVLAQPPPLLRRPRARAATTRP